MHESLDRLAALVEKWPRVCIGSSGEWSKPGSAAWWERMDETMHIACDGEGRPRCRLHGLRMLAPKFCERVPRASADSTHIARSVGIDAKWRGTYSPPTREARAAVLRERIESHQPLPVWIPLATGAADPENGRDNPLWKTSGKCRPAKAATTIDRDTKNSLAARY